MHATQEQDSVETQYGALVEHVALLEGGGRSIVVGSGDRPVAMLNGLVTNDLARLESKRAVYALALTPKGRPIAEMRIVPAGALWLDTPAACLDLLLAHLARYVPPRFAKFEHAVDVGRLSLVGPRAGEALDAALDVLGWTCTGGDATTPVEPLEVAALTGMTSGSTAFVVRREAIEGPGFDLYFPLENLPTARKALVAAVRSEGGTVAGHAAYEIWRVERGIPVFGFDFGPDNLPQETGLDERAISYEKGCYTGQEVVARIHYRGHVNRLLRGLSLSSNSLAARASLEPGASLYRDDRSVGDITTAVHSPRFGAIAIGYVRREIEPSEWLGLEPGEENRVQVHALPFTNT
jgi:folate-binding protein YgfZ